MSSYFPKHIWVDILVLALLVLRLVLARPKVGSSSYTISTMLSIWATHRAALGKIG
jgi:hypothetical protein